MTGPPSRPAVLHYCQHSVGLGHLVRSLAVAGALAPEFRVVLTSGGEVPAGIRVPPGVEVVALPPLGTPSGPGGAIVSLDPSVSLDEAWRRRRHLLLGALDELRPSVVVVELFPLGRRKFSAEVLAFLEAARRLRPRPLVICSVRDLLASPRHDREARDDEAARRLERYFDAVVVHGDPRLARLEETFAPPRSVGVPVVYSGYVVPGTAPAPAHRDHLEILVSAGGGRVGGRLFTLAVAAHATRLGPLGMTTRIVTGPFLSEPELAVLANEAERHDGVRVERFVPDLCAEMAGAAVSVSQCGYNSALDLTRSGVPAVVVPYDEDGETEQAERARRLAKLGMVRVLAPDERTPAGLAAAVIEVRSNPPAPVTLDLGGAEATRRIVTGLLAARARGEPTRVPTLVPTPR